MRRVLCIKLCSNADAAVPWWEALAWNPHCNAVIVRKALSPWNPARAWRHDPALCFSTSHANTHRPQGAPAVHSWRALRTCKPPHQWRGGSASALQGCGTEVDRSHQGPRLGNKGRTPLGRAGVDPPWAAHRSLSLFRVGTDCVVTTAHHTYPLLLKMNQSQTAPAKVDTGKA